ncbi:dephospho-CoA kinase [Fonticella tunisiensis]|uniref:Dephospho-CoA kinase n=1 Tax=Fonticella tunisiensis TaxID=1096341 RepID=A0A4R7KTH1_9CLOT|nr:dephospho-CoA kinase [Fonticella tunisiensis]TDT61188.1 dephospho-CoA kinase [Fonticella tunisiensis]
MVIVGLTGGIASGKSTISNMIRKYNIPVIDADIIAREIVMKGSPVLNRIISEFGDDVLNHDGTLNRKRLADIVFSDKEKLKKLNMITHPVIKAEIIKQIEALRERNTSCCVIDVPLLIEGGFTDIVDYVVLIYVDDKTQLQRLMDRDRLSKGEAKKRISSQMKFSEKKKYADFIIDNSGSIEDTRREVDRVIKGICSMEGLNV